MSTVQYPFIDIAVHERVRERFAAGDGIVLFSSDMRMPLWANGRGAALFGFGSIYDLIDQGPNRADVAFRQVEATARQLAKVGDTRGLAVRVISGFQRVVLRGACELVEVYGERAILFSAAPERELATIGERAARMIEGFEEADTHIAIVDAEGSVAAASERFGSLDISEAAIKTLSATASADPSRLAKRPIATAKGNLPAAIGKLSDAPALYILFTVDTASDDAAPTEAAVAPVIVPIVSDEQTAAIDALAEIEDIEAQEEIDLFPANVTAAEADGIEDAAADADAAETAEPVAEDDAEAATIAEAAVVVDASAEEEAAVETVVAEPDLEVASEAVTEDIIEPEDVVGDASDETSIDAIVEASDEIAEDPSPAPEAVEASEALETPSEPAAPVQTAVAASRDTIVEPDASVDEGFVFRRDSRAVRFVWKIDADGRFTEVSGEFAKAVGPHAADVVGMAFSDLAALFHLDPEGRITELLGKRDTWSGKTIWWPVEGTALVVPVDLAALPTYTRSREFDGFRGFGIVRIADAKDDPDAIGLTLSPTTVEDAAVEETEEVVVEHAVPLAELPVNEMEQATAVAEDQPVETADLPVEPEAQASSDSAIYGATYSDSAPSDAAPREWAAGERPALRLVENPGRRQSDKIIQLEEHRARLTPVEQAAFREIGRQLDRATEETAISDETATAEPVQSEAPAASEISPENVDVSAPAADEADVTDAGQEQPVAEVPSEEEVLSAEEAPAAEDDVSDEADTVAEAEDEDQSIGASEPEVDGSPVDDTIVSEFQPVAANENQSESANHSASSNDNEAGEDSAAAAPESEDSEPEADHVEPSDLALLSSMMPVRERIGLSAEIVDQMPVALLVHSGDELIHCNPEFLKLTGYASLEELDDVGGLDALLQRQDFDGDGARPSGMVVVRADDEILPVTARLQSVRWDDTTALMLALMPTTSDVSEASPLSDHPGEEIRTVARTIRPADHLVRLQVEVEELRAILETATDGVVLIGSDGEIRSVNRAASALFNYDQDEIDGKPFVMLFAHESQRAIVDYLSGLAGHGVASVLNDGREVIGREASGGFLPLFMTIGKLTSSNGYCAVIRDITQWKRTEDELRTAKRAAETANAHKSDFLAHVSHEIRTPLNAIIGFSDMMATERFGPIGHPRYVEYANDIGRSGRHVLDIVNDLLDISKIEAGEMELDFVAVGLNETISEAVSLVQPQANGQRVIIRTALSQAVPQVVADLRSVKQIALNILSNAIRFTPSGGQIVVSTAYEPNGSVALRIRDTGIGMTRAELELAMKPFRQVAGAARKRGDGTGLGLPLTKAMVDANKAAFSISSAPNEGTLVEITFPPQRVLAN
jgi:PAS domain S-box-containing protein